MFDSVYTSQNVYIFHLSQSFRAPKEIGHKRDLGGARDQKAQIGIVVRQNPKRPLDFLVKRREEYLEKF